MDLVKDSSYLGLEKFVIRDDLLDTFWRPTVVGSKSKRQSMFEALNNYTVLARESTRKRGINSWIIRISTFKIKPNEDMKLE
jgi:uncharacterized protein with ParB-like and HNH nuclease domain